MADPLNPAWQDDARCRDIEKRGGDPNWWFPENRFPKNSLMYRDAVGNAKRECRACPQQQACRDYADTFRMTDGIWGGETGSERKKRWYPKLRNRRTRAAEASAA